MIATPDDIEALSALEESLWRPETRYDLAHQDAIFAPDCVEFGRSGKRFARIELIAGAGRNFRAELPLPLFQVRMLSADVALVTYRSKIYADHKSGRTCEMANRSSLWVRTGDSWRLHFHQGTPVSD